MILDLIVLLIIVVLGFLGLRNGFVYSIFRFMGWVVALVAAVFLQSTLVNAIKEYTMLFNNYSEHVTEVCHGFIDRYTGGIPGSVPGAFGKAIEEVTDDIIIAAAEKIAEASFNAIVFVSLVLLIKFIMFLITMLFSKKYHDGFVGGVDGIMGCILGVGQGLIIVLVLLALLMPLSFTISPNFYDWVNDTMSNSLLTDFLYTHNPFLSLVDGFVPDEFLPSTWGDVQDTNYDEKDWNNLV